VQEMKHDIDLTMDAFRQARIVNPVHVARNASQAASFLTPLSDGEIDEGTGAPAQVILLDCALPKSSMSDILRRVKENSRTRAISVVVLAPARVNAGTGRLPPPRSGCCPAQAG
jgi:CheY-like chemotaxis protein